MHSNVIEITEHLKDKHKYSPEYISRVARYMEKNPDLAEEFARTIPKNVIRDHYIEVKGCSLRVLGATTLLSRSSIYVVLSRLREEDTPLEQLIEEELAHMSM